MRAYIFPIMIILTTLLFGLGVVGVLRYFNKGWWQNKNLRFTVYGIVIFGFISNLIWLIGFKSKIMWIYQTGSISTAVILVLFGSLIVTLMLSGLINWINSRLERNLKEKRTHQEDKVDKNRRLVLRSLAITFPIVSVAETVSGTVSAFANSNIYIKQIEYENLPEDLNGFRILHLSDAHLGIYKSVDDLKDVLSQAGEFKPDMTVFTGDIADELLILPDALKALQDHTPEFGTYASLGNHEYFRGIREVQKIFDASPIPLLINSGVIFKVGNSRLFLGGIDDPVRMGQSFTSFYDKRVEQTFQNAPSDSFKILLSHRPDAFKAASLSNLDLTLAGHTHGGQVGFNNRSVFNRLYPDSYIWGHYENEQSQMYVSCGVGHWFPFRLGCPSEAPIIELVSK